MFSCLMASPYEQTESHLALTCSLTERPGFPRYINGISKLRKVIGPLKAIIRLQCTKSLSQERVEQRTGSFESRRTPDPDEEYFEVCSSLFEDLNHKIDEAHRGETRNVFDVDASQSIEMVRDEIRRFVLDDLKLGEKLQPKDPQ